MPANRTAIERLETRRLLSISPLGPEILVNTFTTGSQTVPTAAMDAGGDYVLVWQSDGQDGSGLGVYGQRFDASGVPQGVEFRVNTFTAGAQTAPAVAMDGDGDFIVAWTSEGQDGALSGVYAQRFDAAGNPQGTEFRVNTYTTSRRGAPAVAMDDAGDFVIAWHSLSQDGSGYGVYAQRFDSAGAPQGAEFRVSTATFADQEAPSIAMGAAGNFVVAWQSTTQDGSGGSVHAQRYDASGAAQGIEFQVNTYTTSTQRAPSVAMDADGDFVIAWESYGQDGDHYGIAARRFDSTGAALGDDLRVNTVTNNEQGAPAVATSAAGDFIVTWRGPDANGSGIYAQGYFASGATNDVELPVNTLTGSVQTAVTVAMGGDGDNDIVAAWQSFGQDGSSYGIYARRYEALSGVISSDFHFATAPHRIDFIFDDDVSASLGTDDIVLENLTTMQTIPATDLALSYDAPANTATFTYTGSASGITGVLPDGNYRATLIAAGVTDPGGTPLPDDYVRDFFFLMADANHDGRVNLGDFNTLAANFGQSGAGIDFTRGDFNYDGMVNLSDFNLLASRFGVFLSPALSRTDVGDRPLDEPEQVELSDVAKAE